MTGVQTCALPICRSLLTGCPFLKLKHRLGRVVWHRGQAHVLDVPGVVEAFDGAESHGQLWRTGQVLMQKMRYSALVYEPQGTTVTEMPMHTALTVNVTGPDAAVGLTTSTS